MNKVLVYSFMAFMALGNLALCGAGVYLTHTVWMQREGVILFIYLTAIWGAVIWCLGMTLSACRQITSLSRDIELLNRRITARRVRVQ